MMRARIPSLVVVIMFLMVAFGTHAQETTPADESGQPTCVDESAPEYKSIMEAQELMNKGESALQTGDYATAETAFRQALKLVPDNLDAKLKLAWTLAFAGKYNEALNFANELLKQNPKFSAALLVKAVALAGSGNKVEASKTFEELFKLEPTEERFYLFYARAMAKFGEREAAQRLEQAFNAHKEWYSVAAEAGVLYHMAAEHAKAVELLLAANKGLDKHDGYIVPLVVSAIEGNLIPKLLDELKAVKSDDAAWIPVVKAGILIHQGKIEQAEALLTQTEAKAKDMPALKYFQGLVLLERGEEKDAAEALQAALSSDPIQCLVLRYHVAQALERITNKELCLAAYKQFCDLSASLGVMKSLREKAESRMKVIEEEYSI